MAYEDFKDLTRRTAADKLLPVKAFNIAENPKYDGYECGLASMVYNFFDKRTCAGTVNNYIHNETLNPLLNLLIICTLIKN